MRKQKSIWLLILIVALLFTMVGYVSAQKKVAKIYEPLTPQRNVADFTKPGGIVIGDAMPRAFHYGGRNAARTSDGIMHVSWEDATYTFPYYAHSLDVLGLEWTEPINIPETIGYEGWSRCLMSRVSVDPTNDDIYLLAAPQVPGGVWRTQLSRSTDGGATWSPFMDLGNKIDVPTAEVSWGTCTIGADRVLHITYAYQNQDMYYTRTDLSLADGAADLEGLVFTTADGVTVGAEAISFVPSGVVFQGTIILDRNNDPHIIFSGDGGSDSFGDKTPYHIYYKTNVQQWGPIPPTRLQEELEQCWGMPEMVFDKNNRGYYFMDATADGIWFGTWEPPVDPESATDFGSLNAGQGYTGALNLTTDNYPEVEVLADDQGYLPNVDVDDENDIIYLVASTGSFNDATGAGGDIFALKLENASTLTGVSPADMPWKLHRWVTTDGPAPLGDIGPDVIYDPARTTLDIFWSGAGALNNEANYLDGTAVIPSIDAKPQTLDIGKTVTNPINKGETIEIKGTVKNNGTNPLAPVPVTVTITDSAGNELEKFDKTTPPLLAGQLSTELIFGTWTVPEEKQNYSVNLVTNFPGDEAAYNDKVSAGFFAYPALDEVLYVQTFQDYLNLDADGDHIGYPFPTTSEKGTYSDGVDVGGWTVYDSSDAATFDYYNGWLLSDDAVDNEIGGYIRHMNGIRNDTTYGDMPTGTLAQPQNELLYSPKIDITGKTKDYLYVEFEEDVSGTDGENNWPIHAWVDMTVDDGATCIPLVHHDKEGAGAAFQIIVNLAFYSYDITDLVGDADDIQLRFWWRNLNNTEQDNFATWFIDNVNVIDRPPLAVERDNAIVADQFSLSQNYPNPFNPTTEISYNLPTSSKVKLVIYNVTGQQVATLINGVVTAGTHKVTFNASELPTGVYFYKLSTDNMEAVKKMALIK